MEKSFFNIFKAFFKVGTILLGGGYVILPLLTSELVDKRKWISSDELVEYFALSTSLPGVIAVNISVFTGNKLLGFKGALAAISGVILPAFLAIVILARILSELVNFNHIQYIFWGVGIGVITLLFLAVKEMWSKTLTDKFSVTVYIICLILALSKKISPALIITGAGICGIAHEIWRNKSR